MRLALIGSDAIDADSQCPHVNAPDRLITTRQSGCHVVSPPPLASETALPREGMDKEEGGTGKRKEREREREGERGGRGGGWRVGD